MISEEYRTYRTSNNFGYALGDGEKHGICAGMVAFWLRNGFRGGNGRIPDGLYGEALRVHFSYERQTAPFQRIGMARDAYEIASNGILL